MVTRPNPHDAFFRQAFGSPKHVVGLLELVFPDRSRIVVNTQPPLHELWLASRAGGYHYRHEQGRWIDTRDGSDFYALLSREASAQAGLPLRFAGG